MATTPAALMAPLEFELRHPRGMAVVAVMAMVRQTFFRARPG
jgi:hypothetical protein